MKRDERLIEGIEIPDELAASYAVFARKREANVNVLEAATKAAIASFRENGDSETLNTALDELADWEHKNRSKRFDFIQAFWKELAELYDLDITQSSIPLTLYEQVVGKPRIYYEYVVKDIMSGRCPGIGSEDAT